MGHMAGTVSRPRDKTGTITAHFDSKMYCVHDSPKGRPVLHLRSHHLYKPPAQQSILHKKTIKQSNITNVVIKNILIYCEFIKIKGQQVSVSYRLIRNRQAASSYKRVRTKA